MSIRLWGDGVHDDTASLQELIDTAKHELILPDPEVCYLISSPLLLPSDFRLVLPRFAEVRLAPNSNCLMLRNKPTPGLNPPHDQIAPILWDYLCGYSPEQRARNIEVVGGIWNFNNKNQAPNPLYSHNYYPTGHFYSGMLMNFVYVDGLRISSLTLKDPANFAVTLDSVTHFTVDHITFDFNYGNPIAVNMDGIHVDGGCKFGEIYDLKGACYDDLVALNADESTAGPISDISIHGIYADDCHSAVRLLSANYPVTNVHISDVFGTFYQYTVGITRFYESKDRGFFDGITLDRIYASKAERIDVYGKKGGYVYAPIWIQSGLLIQSLRISEFHRREKITPVESIYISEGTEIRDLVLDHITTENQAGGEMPLLVNKGDIRHLSASNLFQEGKPLDLSL
ncbi:MAG: hypothetical protein II719_03120 [Clostridia bacterium]|nr:hypothetical protein [Clostridia bacterium]